MARSKEKYYVVWSGRQPGIYTDWATCSQQVTGVEGARYKSYPTRAEAEQALAAGVPSDYYKPKRAAASRRAASAAQTPSPPVNRTDTVLPLPIEVEACAIAVDAACSKNPGPMEYRGVDLRTGAEIFHVGPLYGTNNIGEFLAIVHGLALIEQKQLHGLAIYSDSRNGMLWVKQKACNTKLADTPKAQATRQLVTRAVNWLKTHSYTTRILKWETERWGEIPADFGRK